MPEASTVAVDELRAIGIAAGLDVVGVAPAEPFVETKRTLEARKAAGLHGGMSFTYRNPARSTDPGAAVPGARALVVGARAYQPRPAGRRTNQGRVAAYSRQDEYMPLRAALQEIADALRGHGWRARVVADDNALVDREAAYRAGIGWYGKSTNLLLPGQGSWFVLGSVITDAPLPASTAPLGDGCGACRRCIDGCPTGAIIEPGVVDARRCLAWLVQQRGTFPRELRVALDDRIYGCDDCQEVCPPNRRPARDARDGDGDGPSPWVPLLAILDASDDDLLAEHGRWYIADRDPRWLRRNALVALGNVGDPRDPLVRAAVDRYRSVDDELLAEHAAWAVDRLRERADAP